MSMQIQIVDARYYKDELSGMTLGIQAAVNGVRTFIPLDPANYHYAEILRLVEAGELVIQEASPA